jgi:hypothetical protein
MEKSTVLGIGLLAVVGVGAYVYLKGKKSPIVSTTATSTQTAPPTDDTKLLQDLGVKIEEPKVTPYVKPVEGVPLLTAENLQKALLALNIGTTSSNQTRSIAELTSPNYIQAKKLANDIQYLSSYKFKKTPINSKYIQEYSYSEIQMLSKYYGSTVPSSRYMCAGAKGGGVDDCTYKSGVSKEEVIRSMTAKLNALGYKLLPNFDIEKM